MMQPAAPSALVLVRSMNKFLLWPVLLLLALACGFAYSGVEGPASYDSLVQLGKLQLQAGSAERAAASGNAAIKMSGERWEGYALVGGALMNLKRYEEAADTLSKAIERAPEVKLAALRDLRRQCLMAETGSPGVASTPPLAATTSQAEIVLWKSIENSRNPADFQTYLDQYPQGAFVALAQRHLGEVLAKRAEDMQNRTANASAGAGPADALTERAIQTIDFRRGDDGTGRVIVHLTNSPNPINVRQEGNQIVVDFAGTSMPRILCVAMVSRISRPKCKPSTWFGCGAIRGS